MTKTVVRISTFQAAAKLIKTKKQFSGVSIIEALSKSGVDDEALDKFLSILLQEVPDECA